MFPIRNRFHAPYSLSLAHFSSLFHSIPFNYAGLWAGPNSTFPLQASHSLYMYYATKQKCVSLSLEKLYRCQIIIFDEKRGKNQRNSYTTLLEEKYTTNSPILIEVVRHLLEVNWRHIWYKERESTEQFYIVVWQYAQHHSDQICG